MNSLQRLIWRLPEEVSTRWTYDAEVDVLIVGGSLQAFCLLDSLSEAGYATALLAENPVGAGAIEAWNGVVESGYGDPDAEVRRAVEDDWVPRLDARGVRHDAEWFAIARGRADERLRSEWEAADYPFEPSSAETLPREWQAGELFEGGPEHGVSAIDEHAVEPSELLRSFVAEHGDRIVRGDLEDCEFDADGSIADATIDLAEGGTLELESDHVVVAAGGRTPDVLEGIDREVDVPTDEETFRGVHLLAIRAPRGALPEANAHVFPRGVTVAVHREERGEGVGTVTWYVTSESFASGEDANGRIDPRKVGTGFSELFSIVPAVRERAERENSGIEFGVFAGRVLATEEPSVLEGDAALTVSLSRPATAWRTARALQERVGERVEPGASEWLPGTVEVEDVRAPKEGTAWMDWEELVVRYPEADPVPDPPSTR